MKTRADRIRERLEALGMSAAEASRRCGRSLRFVADILEDPTSSPQNKNMRKLAEVLETTVEWLETGAGKPARPLDENTRAVIDIMYGMSERARRRMRLQAEVEAKLDKEEKA